MQLVTKWYEEGKTSVEEVSKSVKKSVRSKRTICYILKRCKKEENVSKKPRTGRLRELTKREEKTLIRHTEKDLYFRPTNGVNGSNTV